MYDSEFTKYVWEKYKLLLYQVDNNSSGLISVEGQYPVGGTLMLTRNLGIALGVPRCLISLNYKELENMWYYHKKTLSNLLKYYKFKLKLESA